MFEGEYLVTRGSLVCEGDPASLLSPLISEKERVDYRLRNSSELEFDLAWVASITVVRPRPVSA